MAGPWEKYAQSPAQDTSEGPWKKYGVAPAAPEADLSTKANAAIQGFGQAASAGYTPQLTALAGGLLPNPTSDVDARLKSQGFNIQEAPDTYTSRRDSAIQNQQNLQKQAPGAYLGGLLGGAIASAPAASKVLALVPGIGGAAAPTIAGRLGQAAKGGAVMGALQNPGDTQGEVNPIQMGERVSQAGTGAALGAAAQGAGEIIKKGAQSVSNASQSLMDYARMKAFKSTGAMLKDFRKAAAFGRINEIGDEMINRGFVAPGSTFEDVADKASDAKKQVGQVIGQIYDHADSVVNKPEFMNSLPPEKRGLVLNTTMNAVKYADELGSAFQSELKGKAGGTQALGKVQTVLQELKDNGNVNNIQTIQEFKEGIDDMLKWNKALKDEPLSTQYLAKIRDYLKDKIQDRIGALDQALGSTATSSLKEANKHYGNLAEISRIAKDRVLRENTNRMFGLTDTITGAAGAATGAILGAKEGHPLEGAAIGAAAGIANKVGRTYGNPLLTQGAYAAGKALQGAAPVTQAIGQAGSALANRPQAAGALGGMAAKKGLLK